MNKTDDIEYDVYSSRIQFSGKFTVRISEEEIPNNHPLQHYCKRIVARDILHQRHNIPKARQLECDTMVEKLDEWEDPNGNKQYKMQILMQSSF